MAEYLLRLRLGSKSEYQVSSAGVAAWAGGSASAEAVTAMADLGVDLTPHRSQPLTPALVDNAYLIVVMTRAHQYEVLHRFPEAAEKIRLVTEFGMDGKDTDIADPIGLSVNVYRKTRDDLDSAIADLILYLKKMI